MIDISQVSEMYSTDFSQGFVENIKNDILDNNRFLPYMLFRKSWKYSKNIIYIKNVCINTKKETMFAYKQFLFI